MGMDTPLCPALDWSRFEEKGGGVGTTGSLLEDKRIRKVSRFANNNIVQNPSGELTYYVNLCQDG